MTDRVLRRSRRGVLPSLSRALAASRIALNLPFDAGAFILP